MDCYSNNRENLSKYHKVNMRHVLRYQHIGNQPSVWTRLWLNILVVLEEYKHFTVLSFHFLLITRSALMNLRRRLNSKWWTWLWRDGRWMRKLQGGSWLKLLHLNNCSIWCRTWSRQASMEMLEVYLRQGAHCALQSNWIASYKFVLFRCIGKWWTLVNETSSHHGIGRCYVWL